MCKNPIRKGKNQPINISRKQTIRQRAGERSESYENRCSKPGGTDL